MDYYKGFKIDARTISPGSDVWYATGEKRNDEGKLLDAIIVTFSEEAVFTKEDALEVLKKLIDKKVRLMGLTHYKGYAIKVVPNPDFEFHAEAEKKNADGTSDTLKTKPLSSDSKAINSAIDMIDHRERGKKQAIEPIRHSGFHITHTTVGDKVYAEGKRYDVEGGVTGYVRTAHANTETQATEVAKTLINMKVTAEAL